MFGFNKKEKTPSLEENRRTLMERLLKVAFENLVSEKDIKKYEEVALKSDLTDQEEYFLDSMENRIMLSSVRASNLFDYRIVMELLGMPEDYIKDIIEHENAHANKAEQLDVPFRGYVITLFRGIDGNIYPQPSAHFDIPTELQGWTRGRQKQAHREIINAPKDYGNKLSEGDRHLLGNLDEMYKE